jgi:hypothetical protein
VLGAVAATTRIALDALDCCYILHWHGVREAHVDWFHAVQPFQILILQVMPARLSWIVGGWEPTPLQRVSPPARWIVTIFSIAMLLGSCVWIGFHAVRLVQKNNDKQ